MSSKLQAAKTEQTKSSQRTQALLDVVALRTRWLEMTEAIHSCLLEGVWLKSLRPVVEGGEIKRIVIEGVGFKDKLDLAKAAAKAASDTGAEKTAIEIMRDNIRNSAFFTPDTEITAEPMAGPGAFASEFTIGIGLKNPVKVQ